VQAGGHPVAENKIRQRDHRLWALVAEAILRCAQATVYDNSGIKGPRFVAQIKTLTKYEEIPRPVVSPV